MASAIMANAADLTAKETAIVDIGAWTARGEQDKLGAAFKAGFGAGLTLNEAKELVGQLYAYCGFPRALNAAGTLMKVADEVKPTEGSAADMPPRLIRGSSTSRSKCPARSSPTNGASPWTTRRTPQRRSRRKLGLFNVSPRLCVI